MRSAILAAAILLCPAISIQAHAQTQMSISIGDRGLSIGFVMSTYPTLVAIPGYPVYYDPRLDSNYFFYDGLYWVFQDDNWYSSTWYDGPWDLISPAYVPLFILRIPVRYYRRPPAYFRGWSSDAPPRWGEHWGQNWERQRSGWDRWNRRDVPRPAPLPTYQRDYTGSRYPRQLDQQRSIETSRYRYQPRDPVSRQIFDQRRQGTEFRNRQQQQQQQQSIQQQNVRQQEAARLQQQQNVRQQEATRLQQQQNVRQQEAARQQQQQNVRQQEAARQQQQQNVRQQEATRLQQQQNARQQEAARQQQQQNVRQQEATRLQQQQNARQQEAVRQKQQNVRQQEAARQKQQNVRQKQPQRSRPARSGTSGGAASGI